MIKIVVICGPTAVGKSSLSIKIAKKYDGEIINADASQFKKLLNIGTAKITNEEMQGIKHHLIDIIDVNDEFSINDFQKMGRDAISSIASRNKLPIIVGGSGLYIDALISDYELKATKSNHNLLNEEYKNKRLPKESKSQINMLIQEKDRIKEKEFTPESYAFIAKYTGLIQSIKRNQP